MSRYPTFITAITAVMVSMALALISTAISADQKTDVGPYEIHYSVIPSGRLTPDVAAHYNITRSKAIGLLNISVLEKQDSGRPQPVAALIEGRVINDIRQDRALSFRQVKEGKAIYYLSQFQFGEGERLEFRADIRPQGHDRNYPIRFTEGLFND